MKVKFLFLVGIFFVVKGMCQKQIGYTIRKHNISQLGSVVRWNTSTGIPYKQMPGANLGAISFTLMGQNRVAFLCNSTSEIIITKKSDGKAIKKFQVAFAPRDFTYEDGFFYVLTENQVIKYDETGKKIENFSFPITYLGVERLTRVKNAIFLLLPTGNSLMIDSGGAYITPIEYQGIITNSGYFVTTQISNNNSYFVKVTNANGNKLERIFTTDKKVAGVYVIGTTKNRIVLDVQTYISENPIAIERFIVSINLNEIGFGTIVSISKVPNCYYVLSNRDILIAKTGSVINMVTAPSGISIFSLTEKLTKSVKNYPRSLIRSKYHYNNHLIDVETKKL